MSRNPRTLGFALALLLITTATLTGTAGSAVAANEACPRGTVPATSFTDTRASVHRTAIDCAAWWELVHGRSATSYAPALEVTRGQTAAMIARLLRSGGVADGDAPSSGFADIAGHPFEDDVDLLAAMGIVSGTSATTFQPDIPVSRAQMATILSQTFTLGFGAPLPDGPVTFTDVASGNTHRPAIGRLVGAGITSGTSATTFSPTADVSRAQMASFVARSAAVLVADGLLELPAARPADDDAYASRMRAAWVHLFDDTLKTRAGIRRLVDELVAADANAVIAQVARRHDAYYDSDVLPRTPDPALAVGFDVLDELLTAAHARGIEVHAWYGVAPTWHDVYRDLPAPDGWIAEEHGREAPVSDRWVTRTSGGAWSEYLDPGVPAVREHVAAVVEELATRYPVDGIHLDYVRYPSADHGYNPVALEQFRSETGATGTPSPASQTFSDWRRQQARRIISVADSAIERSGRDVELSAAVISWQDGPATLDRAGFRRTAPYTRTLQDWDEWVRRGRLDAVMPMNYFRAHIAEHRDWFDQWVAYERKLAGEVETQVVPGPGGYLNTPANALAQVRAAMRVDGAAMYSFQQPTEDGTRQIWDRLAETRWGYHPQR